MFRTVFRRMIHRRYPVVFAVLGIGLCVCAANAQSFGGDPLPSWNDGPSKQAILAFVRATTSDGDSQYVPPVQRVAVFDNDGTLWAEQPAYFQLVFAIDRIKAMAPQHPEWKSQQPYKAIIENDVQAMVDNGTHGLLQVLATTHSNMTTDQYMDTVKDWLANAKHPKTGQLYTDMVYQPQLELIRLLRGKGYKVFIVSSGGAEFIRGFAEQVYGIPPEQVIGSSAITRYQMRSDGIPVLMKTNVVDFVDEGPGKPSAINRYIGRRPIFAFGNSDGDREMLEWVNSKPGPHFAALLHHTDAAREWAYDRDSHVGRLDKALDEAQAKGWTIVDMKQDWKTVFPPKP